MQLLLGWVTTLANINIVQMGDSNHINRHKVCVKTIKRLALLNNYTHSVSTWNKTKYKCPYTAKVAMLYRHVKTANDNDWVAWLDTDVKYQHLSLKAWQSIFFSFKCEFEVLRTSHTLNTGVVHVKATRRMKDFVFEWLVEQSTKQYCNGPADQLSLQTVFMRHFVPQYSG